MWSQVLQALSQEFADVGDAAGATRVVVRLTMAAILGAVIGYDRESQGKAAGLRTHMLVALGASLLVVAPLEHGADAAAVSRIIQGIVAGIGFLGAGAIVKGQSAEQVHGLTTAASIWMTAAVGVTAGLGREVTATLATVLGLLILRVLLPVERRTSQHQTGNESKSRE